MHFQYFPIFIEINKITDCQLYLFEQKSGWTLIYYVLRALETFQSCSRGQTYVFKPEWPKESKNVVATEFFHITFLGA